MSEPEPQVAWIAIERDAVLVTSDGEEAARVTEIAGDHEADIFDGLVVQAGLLDPKRYLPAERVCGIWPRHVEVDLTAAELRALPEHEEPQVERVDPYGGFLTRLGRRFRR